MFNSIHASWSKYIASDFVNHEYRVQKLLECHPFGIILAAINGGKGWHIKFSFRDVGLALAPKNCPDQSQAFK